MDYIILKSDGSLQTSSLKRYIQQGSTGVDKIFVGWADALATDVVDVVFTLPNQTTRAEVYTQTFETDYNYDGEHTSNGWVVTLYSAETTYNGLLFAALRVIRGGIVQVCYPFTLVINETGVRPDADSGVTIEELDSYLANIETLVGNAVRDNTDSQLSNTSENPVQNKVVKQAIDDAIAGVYKIQGSQTVSGLNGLTKESTLNGYVYNLTDAGSLTNEDASTVSVQIGDNVVFVWNNGSWYWDRLSGVVDTSNLVTLNTNQDITGGKTFINSDGIKVKGSSSYATATYTTSGYDALLGVGGINNLGFGSSAFWTNVADFDLGTSSKYFRDLYLKRNIYIGNSSTAGQGKITITNPDLTNQGNWYITSPDQNSIQIIQDTQNTGVKLSRGAFEPLTDDYFSLGYGNYWKNLKLKGSIDFSNNAIIKKDSSHRVVIQHGGNDKIKVGGNETYFANHVEPDHNNTYDLGRTSVAWRDLYLSGSLKTADGLTAISVSDIAKQGLVASQFDNTATYNTGDLVIYLGTLFKVTASVYTPGDFNPSSFTATSVATELANSGGGVFLHKVCLKDAYSNKLGTFTFYRSNATHLTKNELAALLYNNSMYDYTSGTDVSYSDAITGSALKMCPKLYATNATTLSIGYRKVLTTTDGVDVSYTVSTESVNVSSISEYVTIAM